LSKETAFYPRLKALTDEWMDLFGYWAPTVVTDTEEEYRAVRETAGLMDFTMLRKVDIEARARRTSSTRSSRATSPSSRRATSPTARSRTTTGRWSTTARR
jgi:hypothetical protein